MTGSIEKSAWILSIGILISTIILAYVITTNTNTLSSSLTKAGSNARSSGGHFPSQLQVQLKETPKEIPTERSVILRDAFVKACVGQSYENTKIKEVTVKEISTASGQDVTFFSKILFEDGSVIERTRAYLHADGFGGYNGHLNSNDNKETILKNIHIQ